MPAAQTREGLSVGAGAWALTSWRVAGTAIIAGDVVAPGTELPV